MKKEETSQLPLSSLKLLKMTKEIINLHHLTY
nr:MAG TPA: hypothetical protein [Caudoviricetes sp.]